MSLFYKIINPLFSGILRSRLHGLASNGFMLITFVGRKSGRIHTTPVRYVRSGEAILCFTSPEIPWWRNLRGGAEVTLRIKGESCKYLASAIENDPLRIKAHLLDYFSVYPQDTMYYNIRRNKDKDKSIVMSDLERAANNLIVIEAKKIAHQPTGV